MLSRYDPPGFLNDFNNIPEQLEQWSAVVSGWIDGNIEAVEQELQSAHPDDRSQFFNETTAELPGPFLDQDIVWNALPGTLRNRWGREMALDLADRLMPLTQRMDGPGSYYTGPGWSGRFYRPQDEYCEWHVTRDVQGRISRVTFTSEPPEYWQALHGDTLPDVAGAPTYPFTGDRMLLLELYRELVHPDIELEDLECQEDLLDYTDPANPQVVYAKGAYNPYNRWNTTGGIVHLSHPANSLAAEINLGAQATILRQKDGRPVVDPDDLICCAAFGGPNRTSDPTIGSSVNELAALGASVTIRNPVGLSMHHLDLSGFTTPTGEPVDPSFFRVLRGSASDGLIERAVFEVPPGEGYTVSDISIGGNPITRGSQIAEHIVVNIVGRATGIGTIANHRLECALGCCQDEDRGDFLSYRRPGNPCPPNGRPAFAYAPATPPVGAPTLALVEGVPAASATVRRRVFRRLTRVP